jgi:hypothetical protein
VSFGRQKPAGWAFGEIFTSAQANGLDQNLSLAVDGTGGGAYTLSNPLSFSGAAVTFNSQANFAGTNFGDLAQFAGDITVAGKIFGTTAEFSGIAEFQDTVTFAGATFSALTIFNGDTAFGGNNEFNGDITVRVGHTLYCPGDAVYSGAFQAAGMIASGLQLNGNTALGNGYTTNTVQLDATVTLNGPMTCTGTGRVKHRALNGSATSATYSLGSGIREVFVASGSLAADITYTIDNDAWNVDNEEFTVTNEDTHTVYLSVPGNTGIANLENGGPGHLRSVTVKRIEGTWRLIGADKW